MIEDPYRVLGIPQGASEQEIKSAYRKMAKKYHPDLHPNDPAAARKMNEINEAYDMLTNPQKYAAKRQQQQQQTARQQSSYTGSAGWTGDFGGFDFEDIFGFGAAGAGQKSRPNAERSDSWEIQQCVQCINAGRYAAALQILMSIPSTGRNGRWYYLSALANEGAGNTVLAMEHIQKAVQLEPENRSYHQVLQRLHYASETYQRHAAGYQQGGDIAQKLCLGFCFANLCCNPYRFIGCY